MYESHQKPFIYDHVWPILKDMEKFSGDVIVNPRGVGARSSHVNLDSSQSDAYEPESPVSGSPEIQSFSINLSSDENAAGTSSKRPLGIKKSKLKKKKR